MDDKSLTQREQNIIGHLAEVWQLPHEIPADTLKSITTFLMSLQKPYQIIGLQAIADHVASTMSLHMLSLMALVQQAIETTEISTEEVEVTLKQVSPTVFQTINQLSKHLSISSLGDLATLSNILISLQTLSQSESAHEAQSWLYELPTTCYQQLVQEHSILGTDLSKSTLTFENKIIGTSTFSWSQDSTHFGKGSVTFLPDSITNPGKTIQAPILLKRDPGNATDAA